MILKNISNTHYALLQRVCYDQWHLQKCHGRLRAVEIISTPPDPETFQRLVFELVRFVRCRFVLVDIIICLLEASPPVILVR
jgi:hypothetical protein